MVGLSVAVVVFGASVWPAPLEAGADQIDSTQARVQGLEAQVVANAARIRALTVAYDQASTEAGTLLQQVATEQANVARLQYEKDATASVLRADAILSYTDGANSSSGITKAGSDDPAVRAEYLEVAAGDLADAVDHYRTQASEVASAEAALAVDLKASDRAAQIAGKARSQALAEAAGVQAELVSVQGQLQRLQAAQVAARARAATQGMPVGGGLVALVRNSVTPGGGGNAGGVWLQLRECESGNNYRANTGNGFYGAYQFSPQTWANLGYPGRPDLESPAMQDQAAQKLQRQSGWGQWPACSAALGLS